MDLSEKQKMLTGQLYRATCPELQAEQIANKHWMQRYNDSADLLNEQRHGLLVEHFAKVGRGAVIRPPFYCDYGYNIELGANVFMNFNCVILDICRVSIGDDCQIGPAVQIYAADHPRDPDVRRSGLESGKPVTIGCNVWIGGGAIILPGVTVGDNAIIGAGSVVSRDVPAGVTVMGNPARVR
ncbi:sugar O-acetyltransferase [Pseudomonas sp. 148P]|uniref:Sugar O-acetyltransferase n=1 Tax=Pseudomonas ulcerans TaxID=3115852 RepID=A0ABU7HMR0_9PSED|nr:MULTISPECIES: sugar O-acetyltransferase [unclassified Pseudomonas]MEE1921655.1 sugar O-acetyltransferase [Pseudomonas sp. 147P]MEE1932786.1 sugar O-acetyltransferase [Pseudomonas sp. 148P]